jgi:hypothetical protein
MELRTVVACESLKSGREAVVQRQKEMNSFSDGIYHSELLSLFCFVQ